MHNRLSACIPYIRLADSIVRDRVLAHELNDPQVERRGTKREKESEREREREREEGKKRSIATEPRTCANVATANPAEDRIVGGGEEDGTGEISGVPYLPAEPDRPRRWAGGVIGASGPFVSTTALGERRNSLPSCELLEIKAIMRVWYSLIARGSGFLGELEGTCFDSEVLPARCVWNIGGALNISV
ncbi:hypothetical protein KM043_009613 [Ampulex compressa]|nr:hypothetical protein KM043_009613 [Ampulex compressa]